MKKEFRVIADLLPRNIRVLDVGCGDGSLMSHLIKEKNIEVRGLEIVEENVKKCIYKGLSVIEGNAETELHQFTSEIKKSNLEIKNLFSKVGIFLLK